MHKISFLIISILSTGSYASTFEQLPLDIQRNCILQLASKKNKIQSIQNIRTLICVNKNFNNIIMHDEILNNKLFTSELIEQDYTIALLLGTPALQECLIKHFGGNVTELNTERKKTHFLIEKMERKNRSGPIENAALIHTPYAIEFISRFDKKKLEEKLCYLIKNYKGLSSLVKIKSLLSSNLKANFFTSENNTAILNTTISTNNINLIKLLLNYDAQVMIQNPECRFVHTKDQYGMTPLMLYSYEKNAPIVELLLQYGADKSLTDNNGLTALKYLELNKKTTNFSDYIRIKILLTFYYN